MNLGLLIFKGSKALGYVDSCICVFIIYIYIYIYIYILKNLTKLYFKASLKSKKLINVCVKYI
jgi:hypothetical protein